MDYFFYWIFTFYVGNYVFPYFATQVHSGAAVRSLFVQSVARSDEMTDISDVDAHLQKTNRLWNIDTSNLLLLTYNVRAQYVYLKVSIFQLSTVKSIIYVCTSWRVHTAHRQIPQVLSSHHVL